MSDDLRLDSYRRAVKELLDCALQLRWQLARDIDQRAEVETMEKVYRLAQDAKDQQTVLGDQAAAIVTNRRLDHATNILEECSFIMADRGLGGPWPGID